MRALTNGYEIKQKTMLVKMNNRVKIIASIKEKALTINSDSQLWTPNLHRKNFQSRPQNERHQRLVHIPDTIYVTKVGLDNESNAGANPLL